MNRLFLIIFTAGVLLNSAIYDISGQSIELPDFVITGIQSVDLPILKKTRPDFIPTLSKEFFTPVYLPEDFSILNFSNPIKKKLDIYHETDYYNGSLKLGGGFYSLPVGEFFFNKNFNYVLFKSEIWGSNEKAYIPNAGYNVSGASAGLDFYFSNRSPFLPGLRISLNSKYFRDEYKFFGSATPTFKRETHNGYASIALLNNFSKRFNYGVDLSGRLFKLTENKLEEKLYSGKTFYELKFSKFGFRVEGFLDRQELKNKLSAGNNYNYYGGKAEFKLKPVNNMNVKFGMNYAREDTNIFFSPFVSVNAKIDEDIYLFGEYSPRSEFKTIHDFIRENKYYNLGIRENVFVEYVSDVKIAVKYEYNKYFEINGGFNYARMNNFIYFDDISKKGAFDLRLADGVKKVSVFLNLLFHLGPAGSFYGDLILQDVRNEDQNVVPYIPAVDLNIVYSYYFDFGLGVKTKLNYNSDSYTTQDNSATLPQYVNAALKFEYELLKDFCLTLSLENIIDRKNFSLRNYQEKPFDIIGGIDYRW